MLKRVQHDREKGDGIRDRLIEGAIRSLQDDKDRVLRVGRRGDRWINKGFIR